MVKNNPITFSIGCFIVLLVISLYIYSKEIGEFLWASNMGINIGGSEKDDKDDKD
tara:strand:+ start:1936 stop:2100 length:165 start_codon:yes stop_codon:yes gene_type:complete